MGLMEIEWPLPRNHLNYETLYLWNGHSHKLDSLTSANRATGKSGSNLGVYLDLVCWRPPELAAWRGVADAVKENAVAVTVCHLTAVDSFSQCVTNYLSLDPQHQTMRPLPLHRPAGKHVNLSVAAGRRHILLIDECFVEVLLKLDNRGCPDRVMWASFACNIFCFLKRALV